MLPESCSTPEAPKWKTQVITSASSNTASSVIIHILHAYVYEQVQQQYPATTE